MIGLVDTLIRVAKLTTDYISITFIKTVITDSAPDIVRAKFNTSFICNRPSNQSDITRWTNCACCITITLLAT